MTGNETVGVSHRAPGRVRFRMPEGHRSASELRGVREALLAMDGTKGVQANPVTGSVLILHGADGHVERYADVFRNRGFAVEDKTDNRNGRNPQPRSIAREIDDRLRDWNERVTQATDNRMDLRTLVPLALLGVGLIRLLYDRDWKAVPPYVLLYYAFDSYWKLHDRSAGRENSQQ